MKPFEIITPLTESNLVFTCDHATNIVPDFVHNGSLGISQDDMERHIAYDVGIEPTTRLMISALGAHGVFSRFSRLVIDPNRGDDDPTLIMKLYDGTLIPANHPLDPEDKMRRVTRLYKPYHEALSQKLETIEAQGKKPRVIAMHSFTPQLKNKPPRPWHVGILLSGDNRLADPIIEALQAQKDITIGINEPYTGRLEGDSMDRHCLQHNRLHVLVEIRNDLISDHEGQTEWAERLTSIFKPILEDQSYG